MKRRLMPFIGLSTILAVSACNSSGEQDDFHAGILEKDLAAVSYDNGIDMREAKVIAEAYLYVYGDSLGPAPQVYIRRDGQRWLADIVVGVAVSPRLAHVPDVEISSLNGEVSWPLGPTVSQVDLKQAGLKEYLDKTEVKHVFK